MVSSGLSSVFSVLGAAGTGDRTSSASPATDAGGFLDLVDSALRNVTTAQNDAAVAQSGFVAGVPGATLGQALVASDRAEIGWNATVAVRNEVVSAYQSIMSMQF